MIQLDIYAAATISGVRYQWLVYQDGDLARVDMHQENRFTGEWLRYGGLETRLHGGTARKLLDETVSSWLAHSPGYDIERTV